MAKITELKDKDMWEIEDHKKNTEGELIKCYSLKQLSLLEGCDTRTIKNSSKYLPIRIDTYKSYFEFSIGRTKKPYSVKYIRIEELENVLGKKLGYKIVLPK